MSDQWDRMAEDFDLELEFLDLLKDELGSMATELRGDAALEESDAQRDFLEHAARACLAVQRTLDPEKGAMVGAVRREAERRIGARAREWELRAWEPSSCQLPN